MKVPKRVSDRMTAALKQLVPIAEQQKSRDVSEADTVTLVKDLLCDVFGYDKYTELTGEHAIRGTYCDIVIQLKGQPALIVEVKAIGTPLNEKHLKQAIDYAANQGVDWVVLTNGGVWQLYKVVFAKPIDKHLVAEIDILDGSFSRPGAEVTQKAFMFSKEAYEKGLLSEALERQLAFNRHMIAALLVHNDAIAQAIRRELKRVAEVNVQPEEVIQLLQAEVIKRECLDGPSAEQAAAAVNKRENRKLRAASPSTNINPVNERPAGEPNG